MLYCVEVPISDYYGHDVFFQKFYFENGQFLVVSAWQTHL